MESFVQKMQSFDANGYVPDSLPNKCVILDKTQMECVNFEDLKNFKIFD